MKWVWLDGKMVLKSKAFIPCFEEGVLYGCGLFETMRCYGGEIFALEEHIARLRKSCPFLGIKVPSEAILKKAIASLIKKNYLQNACVRLNVSKASFDSHIFLFAKILSAPTPSQYKKGFSLTMSRDERMGETPLNGIKSFNHCFYQRLSRWAGRKGFDEALFLNAKGEVVEGSRTNIFLVKDNHVATPALSCGCLPGVTRAVVIRILKKLRVPVRERRVFPEELLYPQEIFVTNSLMEVMPVTRFNKKPVANGVPGVLTQRIAAAYKKEVEKECCLR